MPNRKPRNAHIHDITVSALVSHAETASRWVYKKQSYPQCPNPKFDHMDISVVT